MADFKTNVIFNIVYQEQGKKVANKMKKILELEKKKVKLEQKGKTHTKEYLSLTRRISRLSKKNLTYKTAESMVYQRILRFNRSLLGVGLGLLFIGMSMKKYSQQQLEPARQLLGIEELRSYYLQLKYLPAAEKELNYYSKKLEKIGQERSLLDDIQTAIVVAMDKTGSWVSTTGQLLTFVSSISWTLWGAKSSGILGIVSGIKEAITQTNLWESGLDGIATSLATIAGKIAIISLAAYAGWKIGNWIGEKTYNTIGKRFSEKLAETKFGRWIMAGATRIHDFFTGETTNKEALRYWVEHGNVENNKSINITQINNFHQSSSVEAINNTDNAVQMLLDLTNQTSNGWS